jgi:hypothetical protein
MHLGRTLWKILLIKLVILFAVVKYFLLPDYLNTRFADDRARADHVLEQITGAADADSPSEPRHRRQP